MGNILKDLDNKKLHMLLFWWHDQYKKSSSKYNQNK